MFSIDLYRDDVPMVGYTAATRTQANARLQQLLREHPRHARDYDAAVIVEHTRECDATCPTELGYGSDCREVAGRNFEAVVAG